MPILGTQIANQLWALFEQLFKSVDWNTCLNITLVEMHGDRQYNISFVNFFLNEIMIVLILV